MGLTVAEVRDRQTPDAPPPTGVVARPSRLGEVLQVADRSDAEIALELGRVVALEAALTAYKAELVMGLAAQPPRIRHRSRDGVRGGPSASEGCAHGDQAPDR